jgi:lipopolysaccharide/colanic/teichoic acid biosynthesis glycosyltransferase
VVRSATIGSAALKRGFDVAASGLSLILLAPVMLLIGAAVKLSSNGAALFKQTRVGREFRTFQILKFRTMKEDAKGPDITIGGDQRITRVGRFLRSTKLDELPQLVNVFRGDMSLVGPRPEIPKYVDLFADDYEEILSVRPGITDFASFQYRDEEAILARSADPEWEYANVILPVKVELGKRYVRRAGLAFDLGIILKTVVELIWHRTRGLRSVILSNRRPIVVVIHLAMAAGAYYLAWWLRFDGQIPPSEQHVAIRMLPVVLAVRAASLYYYRLYEGLWRFTDIWDVERIFQGVLVSQLTLVAVIRYGFGFRQFPRAVFMLDAMLFLVSMVAARLVWRGYVGLGNFEPNLRTVIVGPHSAAALLAHALRESTTADRLVVGLVDVDREHVGLHIHGVPVLSSIFELDHALHKAAPDEVLVVGELSDEFRQAIAEATGDYGVAVRLAPDLRVVLSDQSMKKPSPGFAPVSRRSSGLLPSAQPAAQQHRQKCPACGEVTARRTRVNSLWERARRALSSKRPFRCENCRRRYWLEPTHPRVEVPQARSVDLYALDESIQGSQPKTDAGQ